MNNIHIVGQYLLQPDGSVSPGTDIQTLLDNNIKLVMPTEAPREYGKVAREQPAELGEDGRWYQRWTLVDYVEPEPVPMPDQLTTDLMTALAGLDDTTKQALLQALGK